MKKFWQIGNILSLLFALGANFVVGAQLLDVPAINTISDKYATALTPATYAFSIWSLIYILLVAFVIYQARDITQPTEENDLPRRVGPLFIIASICNGLWTYVFVSEWIGLSVVLLLLLTGSLYVLLWRLRIAVYDAPRREIALVWWPLLLYTGWVTVASVVNIASWLQSLGLTMSPLVVSLVLVGLAGMLLWLLAKRSVRELLLTAIWGIAAIGVRQLQLSDDSPVMITAFSLSGLLLLAVAVHAYRNRQSNPFLQATTK